MKVIVNKVFSIISSLYLAFLYIISENVIFMLYSIIAMAVYFIIDHFIKTHEIKKNLEKILNYVFFYLDEDAQVQLFSRNRHHQIIDLVNIWFIVDKYSKKRFKNYQESSWSKHNDQLLTTDKIQYIKKYLVKHSAELSSAVSMTKGKQRFIGHIMDNLEKEESFQIIFSEIETFLKDDDSFLIDLNKSVNKLPSKLEHYEIPVLSLFLDKNKN